jgi:hypothetical protein
MRSWKESSVRWRSSEASRDHGSRKDTNDGLKLTVHTLKEEHKVRERELDEEVERLRSKLAKAIVRIETELLPELERLGGNDSECEKLQRKLENKPRITQGKNIGPRHNYNQLMEKNKALERDLENLKLKKESMKPLFAFVSWSKQKTLI